MSKVSPVSVLDGLPFTMSFDENTHTGPHYFNNKQAYIGNTQDYVEQKTQAKLCKNVLNNITGALSKVPSRKVRVLIDQAAGVLIYGRIPKCVPLTSRTCHKEARSTRRLLINAFRSKETQRGVFSNNSLTPNRRPTNNKQLYSILRYNFNVRTNAICSSNGNLQLTRWFTEFTHKFHNAFRMASYPRSSTDTGAHDLCYFDKKIQEDTDQIDAALKEFLSDSNALSIDELCAINNMKDIEFD